MRRRFPQIVGSKLSDGQIQSNSTNEFLYNMRISLFLLPSLLFVVAFGGNGLIMAMCIGFMITYVGDLVGHMEATFISMWVTIGLGSCICWIKAYNLWSQSSWNFLLGFNSTLVLLLVGIWGSLQFKGLITNHLHLAKALERTLLALLPIQTTVILTWGWISLFHLTGATVFLTLVLFLSSKCYLDPLPSSFQEKTKEPSFSYVFIIYPFEIRLFTVILVVLPAFFHLAIHRYYTFQSMDYFCDFLILFSISMLLLLKFMDPQFLTTTFHIFKLKKNNIKYNPIHNHDYDNDIHVANNNNNNNNIHVATTNNNIHVATTTDINTIKNEMEESHYQVLYRLSVVVLIMCLQIKWIFIYFLLPHVGMLNHWSSSVYLIVLFLFVLVLCLSIFFQPRGKMLHGGMFGGIIGATICLSLLMELSFYFLLVELIAACSLGAFYLKKNWFVYGLFVVTFGSLYSWFTQHTLWYLDITLSETRDLMVYFQKTLEDLKLPSSVVENHLSIVQNKFPFQKKVMTLQDFSLFAIGFGWIILLVPGFFLIRRSSYPPNSVAVSIGGFLLCLYSFGFSILESFLYETTTGSSMIQDHETYPIPLVLFTSGTLFFLGNHLYSKKLLSKKWGCLLFALTMAKIPFVLLKTSILSFFSIVFVMLSLISPFLMYDNTAVNSCGSVNSCGWGKFSTKRHLVHIWMTLLNLFLSRHYLLRLGVHQLFNMTPTEDVLIYACLFITSIVSLMIAKYHFSRDHPMVRISAVFIISSLALGLLHVAIMKWVSSSLDESSSKQVLSPLIILFLVLHISSGVGGLYSFTWSTSRLFFSAILGTLLAFNIFIHLSITLLVACLYSVAFTSFTLLVLFVMYPLTHSPLVLPKAYAIGTMAMGIVFVVQILDDTKNKTMNRQMFKNDNFFVLTIAGLLNFMISIVMKSLSDVKKVYLHQNHSSKYPWFGQVGNFSTFMTLFLGLIMNGFYFGAGFHGDILLSPILLLLHRDENVRPYPNRYMPVYRICVLLLMGRGLYSIFFQGCFHLDDEVSFLIEDEYPISFCTNKEIWYPIKNLLILLAVFPLHFYIQRTIYGPTHHQSSKIGLLLPLNVFVFYSNVASIQFLGIFGIAIGTIRLLVLHHTKEQGKKII